MTVVVLHPKTVAPQLNLCGWCEEPADTTVIWHDGYIEAACWTHALPFVDPVHHGPRPDHHLRLERIRAKAKATFDWSGYV